MRKLFLIFIPFLLLINAFSQNGQEPQLVNNIVYEKVYLHVDRESYAPREDIWFKAYLVSGISNRLIQGYKNVYVQLVAEDGNVVDDRLILMNNGVAQGDFQIPFDIPEGQYTLRAFTEYQKNFGEESYFHKKIWIAAMKRQYEDRTEIEPAAIDVGFYPEGGTLVLNASNTVAFKAINDKGQGIEVSGYILNDIGDTITPFRTSYLGMGKFALMPLPGRKYRAVLDNFPEFNHQFTNIQSDGVALRVRDEITKVKFGVARNFNNTAQQNLKLSASHKGVDLFTERIEISGFSGELEVPKGKFPLGISKISLINEAGEILAERLIFINGDNAHVVDVKATESTVFSRNKVEVNLNALLAPGDSISGGLSVSVINRDYLTRDGYVSNIKSFLLIDSELKGPIESSASFFTDEEGITSAEKLDLLMLVHGWRSYLWPEIVSNEPAGLTGWEDIGITVKGHVKRLFKNEVVANGKVILGPISGLTFLELFTDEEGKFQFDRLFLRDSSTLMIQAKLFSGRNRTQVFIDEIYIPEKTADSEMIDSVILDPIVPDSYFSMSFSKLEAERKYAIESGTYWLEEVEIVTGKRKAVLDLSEEAERTYGTPSRRFVITEDDNTYLNIYDYLEGKLPGVVVSGSTISIRGGMTPTILLDDVINDMIDIATIPMGDIDHIDIFMSGAQMAAFGSRGADGIIAIYSKMGSINTDFERYIKGRTTTVVDGFQAPRQFYSPKYNLEQAESKVPDFRPTLYWNPFVQLSEGKNAIEFYASDFNSRYLVLVEGISDKGVICTGVGEFRVTK